MEQEESQRWRSLGAQLIGRGLPRSLASKALEGFRVFPPAEVPEGLTSPL